MQMSLASHHEVVVVHSSDLHLGTDSSFGSSRCIDTLSVLHQVLGAATAARADLLVLAGDTFDNNRQPPELLDRAARTLGEFNSPIVILPGNHDPLTPDSVYRRPELAAVPNVCVLGLTVEEAVVFPGLDLEVWGKAHVDYSDMSPLSKPPPRSRRWRLAAAHGHYVEKPDEPGRLLGSWLIRRQDLVATGADYVALGHWNLAARVGDGQINAYYSGSPGYAGTVNVVRLGSERSVEVTLAPLGAV
ncbi:MAG: metallophosphoesterase [Deltaproteobacteria bacterium]|nr:metallophosphoesterase [Deltaproteobacteria bacterium]